MKTRQPILIMSIVVSVVYLIVRWRFLLNPGMTFDLDLYKDWMLKATQFGISQVYRTSSMDYPPLYAYILKPFGWIYAVLAARGAGPQTLAALVKLPPLLFDFGIAALLWRCMSLEGKAVGWRAGVAAAYLFNPAVLFLSAFWGAPDPIHSFFILACFVTIAYGDRFWFRSQRNLGVTVSTAAIALAWAFLTLAALMKPLGLPYFPLLLFFTVILRGVRGAIGGMATSIFIGLIAFSPFLVCADAAEVFKRVLTDIGAMPFTSSNAHNFWWLIGGGWYYSEVPWLGPLTPTHVGLILFGFCYIALCWKAWRQYLSQNRSFSSAQILATAAMVSFSFFMFSTHLHEHHLFATVPLLASFALPNRVWRKVFICVSLGVFINCWLHDSPMDAAHWPYTIGGPTTIDHPPKFDRPYYVAELVAVWSSVFFNLAVYAVTMTGVFWPGKKDWLGCLSTPANNPPAAVGVLNAADETHSPITND
jgi:Gpi18-like mannosyltransferase